VVVNRRGTDNVIPVGVHHLRFAEGLAQLELGASLRSSPATLEFDASRSGLRVHSPFPEGPEVEPAPAAPRPPPAHPFRPTHVPAEALRHIERGRRQLQALRAQPHALRVYARPLLRALLQGLAVVAPEVGLAALAVESGRDVLRAAHLRKLLDHGPSSAEARKVLHDLEPSLQQLGHGEAREVLELLLAENHPAFANRA